MFRWVKSILTLSGLPPLWQVTIYAIAGVALGMVIIIARISNASSYLSDSPLACINCHVMTDAYASWQYGSHGKTAACVDCHIPHSNPIAGLAFKATDGLKHSYVFTMRTEPQVLKLSKGAVPVVQDNCVRCHSSQLMMVRLAQSSERKCWDCHTNTHGEVHSLSASPPQLRPALPQAGIESKERNMNQNEISRNLRTLIKITQNFLSGQVRQLSFYLPL